MYIENFFFKSEAGWLFLKWYWFFLKQPRNNNKSTRHAKNIFQPFFLIFTHFFLSFFCSLRIYAFSESEKEVRVVGKRERKVHLHIPYGGKKLISCQRGKRVGCCGWWKKIIRKGETMREFFKHFFLKLKDKNDSIKRSCCGFLSNFKC